MLDPALRELTASEPLSLAEEYEMQRECSTPDSRVRGMIRTRNCDTHIPTTQAYATIDLLTYVTRCWLYFG